MAGDSSEDRWRRPATIRRHDADRHAADEPEEGEVVPGYHSDADTEEYYNRHSPFPSDSDETVSDDGNNAAACSAPARYYDDATSPYSVPFAASHGSGAAGASSVAAASSNGGCKASSSSKAAAVPMLACPVCGKEFRSQKAVCGHMKVHQRVAVGSSHSQEQGIGKGKGIKRDAAAVVGSWGGTGKRGCSGLGGGRTAATSNSAESDDQSMAIVVAEPQIVLQPMPLAFATPNLSPSSVTIASASPIQSFASPNLSSLPVASAVINVSGQSSNAEPINSDAMDTVVAEAVANPPGVAVVQLHAAPPAAGDEAVVLVHQQPLAPPLPAAMELAPPVDLQQPAPIAARPRQNPKGYTCEECSVWFSTHQGLGGHVAGHRNKEAAAGIPPGDGPCRRGARPEKEHVCKVCGAVFPAGVQLGGHMRKHYAGKPIVPNRRPRLVSGGIQPLILPPPPAVALTLSLSVAADEGSPPAPAVEVAAAQPSGPEPAVEGTAPEPAVTGRVLLFGIDIGVGAKPAAK
ncbi:unnamed protein product [Urochloa decumbens]|uniref:C2H2-type domain-containing protein n=1 Tax=Urochloa decumbens TaxID=240449 RepID=A0ABC8ZKA1_9POAL